MRNYYTIVLFALITFNYAQGQSTYQKTMAQRYPNENPKTLAHPGAACQMYPDDHKFPGPTSNTRAISSECPHYLFDSNLFPLVGFIPDYWFEIFSFLPWLDDFTYFTGIGGDAFYRDQSMIAQWFGDCPRYYVNATQKEYDCGFAAPLAFGIVFKKFRTTPKLVTVQISVQCQENTILEDFAEALRAKFEQITGDNFINFAPTCGAEFQKLTYTQLLLVPSDSAINYLIPGANEWFGDSVVDNLDYGAGPVTQAKKIVAIQFKPVYVLRHITNPDARKSEPMHMTTGFNSAAYTQLLEDIRSAISESLLYAETDEGLYDYLFEHANVTEGQSFNNKTLKEIYDVMDGMQFKYEKEARDLKANLTGVISTFQDYQELCETTIKAHNMTLEDAIQENLNLTSVVESHENKIDELEAKIKEMKSCAAIALRLNALNKNVMEVDPISHRYIYGSAQCLSACRLYSLSSELSALPRSAGIVPKQ